MKATINNNQHGGNISGNRKEDYFYYQYTVVDDKFTDIIILRYYATKTRIYACIWVHAAPLYLSGGGYAGGYGYDKASAAAESAINDAGIKLSEPIGGCGDSAVQKALKAIALACGYDNVHILTAHG